MTENDSKTLLALANSWEESSKTFAKAKRRAASMARKFQEQGDFVRRDVFQAEAAESEIRSELLHMAAEKLALKVGELMVSSLEVGDKTRSRLATGTRPLSSKSGAPKGPGPFEDQRRGEVA